MPTPPASKYRLQIGIFIKTIEYLLGVVVLAHLDDRADAGAVGLVADIRDAREHVLLLLRHCEDLAEHRRFIYLIGHLGHDNIRLAIGALLDACFGADGDLAASRLVGFFQAFHTEKISARGEIRPGNDLHQLAQRKLGIADAGDHATGAGT